MDEQSNLKNERLKKRPIMGMSVETFVRGYKGQSQMDVNMINGLDISGHGAKLMGDILDAVKKHR